MMTSKFASEFACRNANPIWSDLDASNVGCKRYLCRVPWIGVVEKFYSDATGNLGVDSSNSTPRHWTLVLVQQASNDADHLSWG
jgi:hypothetical protein